MTLWTWPGRQAKAVVLAWDEANNTIATSSLHYFEDEPGLRGGRAVFPLGPRVIADPQACNVPGVVTVASVASGICMQYLTHKLRSCMLCIPASCSARRGPIFVVSWHQISQYDIPAHCWQGLVFHGLSLKRQARNWHNQHTGHQELPGNPAGTR